MSRVHSLRFDALEERKLLTKAHLAPAPAPVPVMLTGSLLVDTNPKATTSTVNADGSRTTAVAVNGQLGAMGQVSGVWSSTSDAYGDGTGLEALRLHNAQGSIILEFSEQNLGRAMPAGHGAIYHEVAQRVYSGTGAYARASENGSIQLITNRAQTVIETLSIHTRATVTPG